MLLDKITNMQLILASSSPYRRSLLERLQLAFEVRAPDIDETRQPGETPQAQALRLAVQKAGHVARTAPDALVIGSDQVAEFGGMAIGKPGNQNAAFAQLRQFSGQTVRFHTAVCVRRGTREQCDTIATECDFLPLTDAQIHHYLHAEKPWDTAGSAKVEKLGIALMQSIRSEDPTALIGLPLMALCRMLRHFGLDPLSPPPRTP